MASDVDSWPEIWRGGVNTWECDEMGHMNVRFYVVKAVEGLASLAALVGLPEAFCADATSTLLAATMGLDLDKAALRRIAADILDLPRAFNRRGGLRLEDDILPARMHREALEDSGRRLPEAELTRMVDEYHRIRGWKTG